MGQKAFVPQEYDVFAGLDVDKKSISVTFSNHQQGFVRSFHMPYSVENLLKHVRKHFPDQKVAFVLRLDRPGMECMMGEDSCVRSLDIHIAGSRTMNRFPTQSICSANKKGN